MKTRLPLIVCCLLTTLLVGVWLGQSIHVDQELATDREVVPSLNADGWQLTSGQQTGPSAVLKAQPEVIPSTSRDEADDPAVAERDATIDVVSEPDVVYFPEVIQEVAGNAAARRRSSNSNSDNSLSDDEAAVWKAQLKSLPPDQAEEILNLRKQLGSVASEMLGLGSVTTSQTATDIKTPRLFPLTAEEAASPIPLPATSTEVPQIALVSAAEDSPVVRRLRLEALANYQENLANARTPGFKRRQIVLLNVSVARSELAPSERDEVAHAAAETDPASTETAQKADPPPALLTQGKAVTKPAMAESIRWLTRLDLRQGKLISTSNPLDIAMEGQGWLTVQRDGQREFVRTGMLGFDTDGRLGIRTGAGLLPLVPAIQLPPNQQRIVISESGELYVETADGLQQRVAQLIAVGFHDASALRRTDGGTYAVTDESGSAVALRPLSAGFLQSALEGSNVDPEWEQAELDHLQSVAGKIAGTHRKLQQP